jgi:cytoskeletal protein CcmA (bactofilin family)
VTEAATRNNLKIIGTTNSAGGIFKDVKVTGECHFAGDVDCEKFSLTGNARVAGNLRMTKMKITGEVTLDGNLEGESLRGQGEVKAASIRIDDLHINGNLEVNGDCEGEHLHIAGAFNVGGLLSAEQLEISLYGPCKAKEVGGSKLSIKKSKAGKLLHLMKQQPKVLFEAGLIEGDTIELNHTKASIVRGERVFIGADCEIDTVEYRNILEIHKNAVVKHQVKL